LNDAVTDNCNTHKNRAYVLPIKDGMDMLLLLLLLSSDISELVLLQNTVELGVLNKTKN
jgi:hypothetical protein